MTTAPTNALTAPSRDTHFASPASSHSAPSPIGTMNAGGMRRRTIAAPGSAAATSETTPSSGRANRTPKLSTLGRSP